LIVAHFLGDRNQPDAVLRQLADVEFQFEMVAEEAAERMDDHHFERRGLARARLDQALELGAAVICGGRARSDVGLGELVAARFVHDAPCLYVVPDRAARSRPGTRHDIKIGRQFAECGAVAHG
jgi:hypothetical protein